MRTRLMTGCVTTLLLSAVACGGSTASHRSPPRPSASISGRVTPSSSCHIRPSQQVRVDRRSIDLLVLCPLSVEPGKPVTLDRSSALFGPIVVGLATPGRRYPPGTPCPAYADVEQTVLARADRKWLVADLPRDSCGHYDRGLLALLASARAG